MEMLKDILAVVGALTGTIALGWRVLDEFGSFLRIAVKVELGKGDWATALTTVDNKGTRPKVVSYALLLIGPESKNPIETAKSLARQAEYKGRLEYTNDIEQFKVDRPLIANDRALIPLQFYYSESVDIADETVTYRTPIDIKNFKCSLPYAVRFFVFGAPRLHRSTQDAFIKEKPQSAASE